jgi:hypothetical protein
MATLPLRLRQARAEYHRRQRDTEHSLCPKTTKTAGPHLGLYCATHGTWLAWIPKTSGSPK